MRCTGLGHAAPPVGISALAGDTASAARLRRDAAPAAERPAAAVTRGPAGDVLLRARQRGA